VLGPFPADAQPHERCPHGFARHLLAGQALAEADGGEQIERPQARFQREIARAAVQQRFEALASGRVEGRVAGMRGMRAGGQGREATGVEGDDGVAHGLVAAA
jgi:hypothetical protein